VKGKIVSQVVAVIGILALSATLAQAGSGSGGQAFALWYECRSVIGGTNVGENVSILSPDAQTVLEANGIVGMSVLACRQVQVNVKGPGGGTLGALPGDHLTCYTLAAQGKPETSNFNYSDAFFPSPGLNLTALGSRYLCATSGITAP
jgi:hypothetical protein